MKPTGDQQVQTPTRRDFRGIRLVTVALLAGLTTSIVVTWGSSALLEPCEYSDWVRDWAQPEPDVLNTRIDFQGFQSATGIRRCLFGAQDVIRVQFTSLATRQTTTAFMADISSGATSFEIRRQSDRRTYGWAANWGQLAPWCIGATKGTILHYVEDARGWPLPCVWCCLDLDAAGKGVAIGGVVIPGQASPNDLTKLRVLPYRPIWWGLLGNTLIYAAAWALLVFGFTAPRRWLRVRRGLCSRCAYDLRSLPGTIERCPECGSGRLMQGKAR